MAYVAPTTRSDGYIVAASVWNQDVVNNVAYFKDAPNFDGLATFDVGLAMATAQKLYFDGIAGTGDTFITEATGNNLWVVVGGRGAFVMNATSTLHDGIFTQSGTLTLSDNVGLTATKKIYLDGIGMTGDTYIVESSANVLDLVSGGVTITIVSGVLSSTKELKSGSAATAVSGFVNGLNVGTWDMVGFESTGGVRAVFGGYRASQWTQVGLYTSGTEWVRLVTDGGFGLKDGITAPATVAGFALLYVDTADGDLKVKFGDGTVKTIVVDT